MIHLFEKEQFTKEEIYKNELFYFLRMVRNKRNYNITEEEIQRQLGQVLLLWEEVYPEAVE